LVGLSDLILGEVRLGHGEVTLVGLGDLILGEVRVRSRLELLWGRLGWTRLELFWGRLGGAGLG